MPDSEDPKQVSSSDLRNSQFGGGFISADIVNAGRIGGDIYNIHLGQQTVASGNSVQSQNQPSDRSKKKTHSKKLTPSKARKLQIYEQRWLLKPMYPASSNTNNSFRQSNAP